jgi:hypothetical protein
VYVTGYQPGKTETVIHTIIECQCGTPDREARAAQARFLSTNFAAAPVGESRERLHRPGINNH